MELVTIISLVGLVVGLINLLGIEFAQTPPLYGCSTSLYKGHGDFADATDIFDDDFFPYGSRPDWSEKDYSINPASGPTHDEQLY